MPSESIKERHQQAVEEVFNQKNLEAIDEYFSADIVDHSLPPGFPPGLAGKKMQISALVAAFPDLNIKYEDLIVEGEKVSGRYKLTGTHDGELFGIPATGKKVDVSGMDMIRFADGKVAEHWTVFDQLGMMQQLGVIPS